MRVAIGSDHGGAALKPGLLRRLADSGYGSIDLCGDGPDPNDDDAELARRLARAIQGGVADRGILVCSAGIGASVAANRVRGVRATVAHDSYSAHQGVQHDDMNFLFLGGRVIGPESTIECARAFVGTRFSGEGRRARRRAMEAEDRG